MQITPYFMLTIVLILIVAFLLYDTMKHLGRHTAKQYTLTLFIVLFGLVCFALSLWVKEFEVKVFFNELKFLLVSFLALAGLSVYYSFLDYKWNKKTLVLLAIIPVVNVLMCFTNSHHHLFRKEFWPLLRNGITYIGLTSGPWFMVYFTYSLVLYFSGLLLLLLNYTRKPKMYRGQTTILIVSGLIVILIGLSIACGLVDDYGDLTMVAYSFAAIMQYYALINYTPKAVREVARSKAVGGMKIPIIIFDRNEKMVDANEMAYALFDMDRQHEQTLTYTELMTNTIQWEKGADGEQHFLKHKEYYAVIDKELTDNRGMFVGRVIIVNNITDIKTTVNGLEYAATHDYLTGLKNRHAFALDMGGLSPHDYPCSILYFNINNMKLTNNIFGMEYGDKLITMLGKLIEDASADKGFSARLNADEFVVLLKRCGQPEADAFIKQIEDSVSAYNENGYFIGIESACCVEMQKGHDVESIIMAIAEDVANKKTAKMRNNDKHALLTLQRAFNKIDEKIAEKAKRTEAICGDLAQFLGLPPEEKRNLGLIAAFHDIGLLSMSKELLEKEGSFSNEEWEEVKNHTLKGYHIALGMPELNHVAGYILAHHERFDGYGYPHRLKGREIPFLSRVLAVAECYDELVQTMGKAEVEQALQNRRGTQLDPYIVQIFLSNMALS